MIVSEPYDPHTPGRACTVCNTAWPASEPDDAPHHHHEGCLKTSPRYTRRPPQARLTPLDCPYADDGERWPGHHDWKPTRRHDRNVCGAAYSFTVILTTPQLTYIDLHCTIK